MDPSGPAGRGAQAGGAGRGRDRGGHVSGPSRPGCQSRPVPGRLGATAGCGAERAPLAFSVCPSVRPSLRPSVRHTARAPARRDSFPQPMMCLENDGSSGSSPGCGGRLRAGDEEEEEDGERGCCGRGAEGEVQTLSGRMNPPASGKHPDRPAALRKAPTLGRARVAAAGILSVGNVLNYLDRYTVAGERTPRL